MTRRAYKSGAEGNSSRGCPRKDWRNTGYRLVSACYRSKWRKVVFMIWHPVGVKQSNIYKGIQGNQLVSQTWVQAMVSIVPALWRRDDDVAVWVMSCNVSTLLERQVIEWMMLKVFVLFQVALTWVETACVLKKSLKWLEGESKNRLLSFRGLSIQQVHVSMLVRSEWRWWPSSAKAGQSRYTFTIIHSTAIFPDVYLHHNSN